MGKILEKRLIRTPDVFYYRVEAPLLAKKAKPGQFVIVRLHEKGERIPLSLADIDPVGGAISLVVMAVGKTTKEMSKLEPGDEIMDLCGPLGLPTEIEKGGSVVLVGGGVGVAPLYPIARAFKEAGNRVVAVIGARSGDLLIYENEMQRVCDKVLITTDDGSTGIKGVVTDVLKDELEKDRADLALTVGPAIMMKHVCETTRPFGVKTIASLNTIMIDGTGMCGGCRVLIGGKVRFACTDGPEFDGHQVAWDELINRRNMYIPEEREALGA